MDPYEETNLNEEQPQEVIARPSMGMRAALVGLLALCGIATVYGLYERNQVQQLRSEAAATNNSVSQLQAQLNTLTAKLNSEQTPPAAAPAAAAESSVVSTPTPAAVESAPATEPATPASGGATSSPVLAPKPAAKHAATKRRATATDKRYSQLKSQLDDQQKQLKDAQDQIAKNRADLEGSISSTRDELNGSIAKTHEELVALEKRGERSYFEFDLTKSKQFQRYGPVTISLRRVDTKHKNYDLAMIVDDNELNKKKVNLYEPIWIHTENGAQPIQVVVNRVEKNLVHGYVSAPKYKQSELAALSTSTNPSAAPASNDPSQSTTPTQPQ
jgi:hypothetical protein